MEPERLGFIDETGTATAVRVAAGSGTGTQPVASSVTAVLGSASIAYGQSDTVAVTVAGGAITPTGAVSVYDGTTRIASGTLAAGRAVVTLPSGSLRPGTHQLSVGYSGDEAHTGSSTLVTLVVAKATPVVKAKTKHGKVVLKVRFGAGVVTGGKVKVKIGAVHGKAKVNAKGVVKIVLRHLHAGKHRVVVTYHGTSTVVKKKVHLSVRT